MRTSEQLDKIATALAKAQASIGHAVRDKQNPFFQSTYADLASVKDACQEHLSANGIATVQAPTTNEDGSITLYTRLIHSSGQWIEADMTAHALKDNKGNITAQSLGSVVTYLRRYMLSSMANVATEDDDGEGAAGRSKADGDKVTVAGKPIKDSKQPDSIEIAAADIIVPAEFWDRPDYGLATEDGWKVGDWLSALRAHIEQAPSMDAVNRLWQDNASKINKLSEMRQWWCNEVFSNAIVAFEPSTIDAA